MLTFRRPLAWLWLPLAVGFFMGLGPNSAEAQIFSRLRSRCRPVFADVGRATCRPAVAVCCDSWTTVAHPVSSPDCGDCSYFYDPRERRWFYVSKNCNPHCECLLPVESGNVTTPKMEILKVSCQPSIAVDQVGFEMSLEMGRGVERKFLFVLPPRTSTLAVHKYQIEVASGVYWLVEVSYDSSNLTEAKPMRIPPTDPQSSKIKYVGPGAAYTHTYTHDTSTTSSANFQFRGFNVTVTREIP